MIIRKATTEDVEQFSIHICDEDVEEFNAREPNRDLRETLLSHLDDNSVVCVDEEGFVYAYGGHLEGEHQDGACWFLTSRHLTDASLMIKLKVTRLIKQHAEKLLQTYPFLWNYVWSGNTFHKRFLEVIGAVFHYEQPYHSEWTGERFDLFIIGGGK